MLDIRRILCPVDFSEASQHALDHAVALAKWYDAAVTVLHVCRNGVSGSAGDERRRFEEQLKAWSGTAADVSLMREAVLERGDPASVILGTAASAPPDLLVMGTHGRGVFTRLILGSVAEKVLRSAECPVLTVPPPAVSTSVLPFKRLLCPVDFSPSSHAALRFAFSLAQESDASLTIQHVLEWPEDEQLFVAHFGDVHAARRLTEARARQQLEALIPDDVRRWCAPYISFSYGKAYERILERAKEDSADVIVIGVRGRKPLDLMLFGSTTNQVVRHATCPVLTLKSI